MDHGYLLTLSIHLAEIPTSLQNFAYTTPHWDWNENTSWDCVICHSMLDGKEWKIQNLLLQCFCRCLKQAGNIPEGKGQKEREMVDWMDCWCLARWLLWATYCWWERVSKLEPTAWIWSKCLLFAGICLWSLHLCSGQKLLQSVWWSVIVCGYNHYQVWNVIFDRS